MQWTSIQHRLKHFAKVISVSSSTGRLCTKGLRDFSKVNSGQYPAFRMNIPNRWNEYPACGVPIEGERIISFRTPLSKRFDCNVPDESGRMRNERFTPSDAVANIRRNTGQNLLYVIDLTYTKRYYEPKMFREQGVEYCKIYCEGHQIPSLKVYQRFKAVMEEFFQKHAEGLIGVHCTHGLNRTGYLVCRYLIEEKRYIPQQAVHAFNRARGCAIERTEYIRDLYSLGPPHTSIDHRDTTVDLAFLKKWLKDSTKVKVVDKERLVAFKTPLCKEQLDKYEKETGKKISLDERFTADDVQRLIKPRKSSRSLVINMSPLTNCYDAEKFSAAGIEYRKIEYPGPTPDEEFVTRVKRVITEFLAKDNEGLIGIHCIDGINLTGYVICRYLMDCQGYTADKAFQAFFRARAYNIEDIQLLEKLKELSSNHSPKNKQPQLPKRRRNPSPTLSNATPQNPPRRYHHTAYNSWDNQGYSFDYPGESHWSPWHNSAWHAGAQMPMQNWWDTRGSGNRYAFSNFSEDYGQRQGNYMDTRHRGDQYRDNRGNPGSQPSRGFRPGTWDVRDLEEHLIRRDQYRYSRR